MHVRQDLHHWTTSQLKPPLFKALERMRNLDTLTLNLSAKPIMQHEESSCRPESEILKENEISQWDWKGFCTEEAGRNRERGFDVTHILQIRLSDVGYKCHPNPTHSNSGAWDHKANFCPIPHIIVGQPQGNSLSRSQDNATPLCWNILVTKPRVRELREVYLSLKAHLSPGHIALNDIQLQV